MPCVPLPWECTPIQDWSVILYNCGLHCQKINFTSNVHRIYSFSSVLDLISWQERESHSRVVSLIRVRVLSRSVAKKLQNSIAKNFITEYISISNALLPLMARCGMVSDECCLSRFSHNCVVYSPVSYCSRITGSEVDSSSPSFIT